MFYPAYVDLAAAFFYPLGNTPAACLTQHLPPELPARVLALGCGDARNVLFTAYCEAARADARPIDITSCDLQRAVIARNILLFSLILDDRDGRNQHAIWSIYYHQFLDSASFELLQRHAKTLTETSSSLDEWHRGPHGSCLRVCDSATLAAVHEVWLSYVNADARPSRAEFERAKQAQEAIGGAGINYWRSGTTDGPGATAKTDVPNPMFSGQMDNLTLHYGTDPLLGFHLATAYLPLTHASPLNPNQVQHGLGLDPLVKTARLQFEACGIVGLTCQTH
ncbi:putative mynd finger family protein [Diplodia seriata]|uniref:Putative mynd finger family protein n=1 Tax=Diplodia seriata TaxID=420778 RepID=A0A0G2DRJ8_9PEZI|nr:putative mynd finger family protein [Diplodia seriata]